MERVVLSENLISFSLDDLVDLSRLQPATRSEAIVTDKTDPGTVRNAHAEDVPATR